MINTYVKYGALIATSLIGYFLIMKLLGLHEYPGLSAINGLIFAWGMYKAMVDRKRQPDQTGYSDIWQSGFFSGAVAILIFTGFMALYMYQINNQFASNVLDNWGIAYNNGVLTMLISIVLMGLSTAVVLALTFMQRLKDPVLPQKSD